MKQVAQYFYDWLTVYQTHNCQLPVVDTEVDLCQGQGAVSFQLLPVVADKVKSQTDIETGEVDYETLTGRMVRGSFATSLKVKCDGTTVFVDGNPSKFCRLDNLFGFASLDDCIAVYNKVLRSLGLPPFTKSTTALHGSVKDDSATKNRIGRLISDGARFARLDLTMNYATGSMPDSYAYVRGISSQCLRGQAGHLYADGGTSDWLRGSRRGYAKIYIKCLEMKKHLAKKDLTQTEMDYLSRLLGWLEAVGCVREEHSFKSLKLKDSNCHIYGLFNETEVAAMLAKRREFLTRANVSLTDYQRVAETLLSSGLIESPVTARRLQRLVTAWLNGENLSLSMSRTALFKARSELLPLGIDIRNPCDVTRLMPRVRTIEIRPLEMPDWYIPPSVNNIHVLQQAA